MCQRMVSSHSHRSRWFESSLISSHAAQTKAVVGFLTIPSPAKWDDNFYTELGRVYRSAGEGKHTFGVKAMPISPWLGCDL